MTNLLSVIDRVAAHEPQEFIAPVLDSEYTTVRVVQESIPYAFHVRDVEPGWWVLRPKGKLRAEPSRTAHPHEYLQYLGGLPRFYVICLYRLAPHTWLCVPWNASDAHQRGWKDGEPRPLHLVREAVVALDIVDARSLAGTMLYHLVDNRITHVDERHASPDVANAREMIRQYLAEIERLAEERAREEQRREHERVRAERMATVEERVRHHLDFIGAELVEWWEAGERVRVTWTYRGQTRTVTVGREMELQTAGICLSGRARDYNLSAAVAVIEGSLV